ncbi:MAG: hypothetical protein J5833_08425, partial [Victivallales bacterium]|nr:hypothetical protein [Victivallales bacterium]
CRFKDAFGRDISSFEILNKRNLVQRTVAFAHKHGKTVILHAQRDFFPMLHGLADYFYPGEQYDSLLRRNPFGYTDDVPDTIYRSEFNRNVLGVGIVHLPALGQASPENFGIPAYTEAMLCMLQSHDVETAPLYVCTAPVNKLYDILERYGVQSPDVKCHLYHEQSEIKSSAPSLRVTWYECPENRRLLFIANKDVQPVRSTMDVSAIAGGDFWAFDEYHVEDISVKDGKFDIYVPGRSFSVVCFPPKSVYPLHDGMDRIWRTWKGNSDTEFTHSKDGGIDGSPCLMLTTHETGGGCFHYDFHITPGRTYIYKVKARRSDMEGDFCLMIQARVGETLRGGDARPVAAYSEPSTEWKEVLLKFTVPTEGAWSECDNVLLTLSGKGKNAQIWFDDFSIEESFDPADRRHFVTSQCRKRVIEDAFDGNSAWAFWKLPTTKVADSHVSDVGHSAPGAACITVEDGNDASGCFTRHVPATPGAVYNFIVFAKADRLADDAAITLGIQGQDKSQQFLGTPVQSVKCSASECRGEWKRLVLSFRVPKSGKWNDCGFLLVTLGAGGNAAGNAYFDDFTFYESK